MRRSLQSIACGSGRACGDAALDAVWGPLLLRKFGDEAERVPLAWLASKLGLRRKLRGKSAGREMLGYPKASFQRIAWALRDEIEHRGGDIEIDRSVAWVEQNGSGFRLRCAAPKAYRVAGLNAPVPDRDAYADLVLFTTPTHLTRTLTEWPEPFARRLEDWSYRAAVVLLLELTRPFSSTYWVNVVDREAPFLGLIEHTNLVPAERYPARYLYVSNYVAPGSPLLRMSADELLRHYAPALRRASPTFSEHFVQRRWVFREESAQPVPRVENRHRVLPFETPRPGLFLANTTQIYPEDRGTNYSVRLGQDVAGAIASAARARRPVEVRVA
jgi:protoporphyrinogen oxidase